LDAEKSGANVTGLLAQLNDAANLLVQAENSYSAGDTTAAANKADSVLTIAQEVNAAAQVARETASVNARNVLVSAILLAIIGALVISLGLFMLWRWFKQRYLNKLSETKPEVTSNET
jgi:predicted dinucleotide-utilizing enzyme